MNEINTADPDYNKDFVKRRLDNLTDPTLIDRMTAGQKRAAANKKKDPDYYKKLGKQGAAKRKNPFHYFQHLKIHNPEEHLRITRKGGRAKR